MAELSPNTCKPPKWIHQNFIQAALRQGLHRRSLKVNTFEINNATNIGDNYLSQMLRVKLNLDSQEKGQETMSIIIKSMPQGEAVEKYISDLNLFNTEMKILGDILPLMHNILNKISRPKLAAELYFKQELPHNVLVLEDLCQSGFKSVNRLEQLDLHHSTLAVEGLAMFHAASLVAAEKQPEIKTFSSYWMDRNQPFAENFVNGALTAILECLESWGTFSDELVKKIEKLKGNSREKLFFATEKRKNDFNVLNHGDPWTSNMMFKYSEDVACEVKFVDFQFSIYNCPVYDLLYFLFTSPKIDVRLSKIDFLLQIYHKKLEETCQKLGFPLQFTYGDLLEAFSSRLFFGFIITINFLPFMMVPTEDVTQLNEFLTNDAVVENKSIRNQNYKNTMEVVLPYFMDKGVLD